MNPLHDAFHLAGYALAHGIWCVSDGEVLIPMVMQELPGNPQRTLTRLAAMEFQNGVELGRTMLERNEAGAACAVVVFDGYLTVGERRRDALFAEVVVYGPPQIRVTLGVPYRQGPFVVHRPKVVAIDGADASLLGDAFPRLWEGVDSHAQAAAVWNAHLDQSE
jgi:hypothetical protein